MLCSVLSPHHHLSPPSPLSLLQPSLLFFFTPFFSPSTLFSLQSGVLRAFQTPLGSGSPVPPRPTVNMGSQAPIGLLCLTAQGCLCAHPAPSTPCPCPESVRPQAGGLPSGHKLLGEGTAPNDRASGDLRGPGKPAAGVPPPRPASRAFDCMLRKTVLNLRLCCHHPEILNHLLTRGRHVGFALGPTDCRVHPTDGVSRKVSPEKFCCYSPTGSDSPCPLPWGPSALLNLGGGDTWKERNSWPELTLCFLFQ